jgi:Zn-dependent protease
MDISPDQVRAALLSLIAFIISVSVHEFGHAWMANRLGDGLPRQQGRLTLSPMAHIDPLGTILMPLVGALAPGGLVPLAWGKPVQVTPSSYSPTGRLLVALAGPAMNLILAVIVSVLFVVLGKAGVLSPAFATALVKYLIGLNLVLMFFNLLPLPPLDGGAVLTVVLPNSLQFIPRYLQRYGVLVLLILIVTPAMSILMGPAYRFIGAWVKVLVRLVAP